MVVVFGGCKDDHADKTEVGSEKFTYKLGLASMND